MDVRIEPSWKVALTEEFAKPYFEELRTFVRKAYLGANVFPPPKLVFNAFDLCSFDKVRVVILGQDPYHGFGQAQGLCFSVPNGITIPPSLKNIYKELNADLGLPIPKTGDLSHWGKQGVLLLNATLTVESGRPASHQKQGWETFTDAVIKKLSDQREHLVFLLWGRFAQEKGAIIDTTKHLVLTAAHPSPFSATGFLGCKHFSKTNTYLKAHHFPPIDWAIR